MFVVSQHNQLTALQAICHCVCIFISSARLSQASCFLLEPGVLFFVGGDYKFLPMIMGINSATANSKDSRWENNLHNEESQRRTLEEIHTMCHLANNFGCVNPPLIDLELNNVVPDELHLLLRIIDRLFQNIIDKFWGKPSKTSTRQHKPPRPFIKNSLVKL